ncbi:alpha/beta hydrolase [Salinimonas sediminis]|uniref:Alpha/beta hydrolase n=1 Tax=Salinimonas sediminis TaxID=2303538 RepID=A0A346NST4_9ALTE|nr:alpha/beta hydrolase [Salinimonas sediminis]
MPAKCVRNNGGRVTHAPVLFLPGTLCDERIWLPVWRLLPLTDRRYVPLQWATSLDDMLALTGDRADNQQKVHLVGYSMGGYIAALWALRYPEKVASLTLIGYNPEGLGSQEIKQRSQLVTMLNKGQFTPQNPAYINRFVHPDFIEAPQVAGVMTQMADDLGASTLLAHTQSTTPRPDMVPELRQASFAVNLIAARQDAIARYDLLSAIAPNLHNCTLYSVEDAAHMMLLERPEDMAGYLKQILTA